MNWVNQVKRTPKIESKKNTTKNTGLTIFLTIICLFGTLPSVLFSKPLLVLSAADITSDYIHSDDYQGRADKIAKEALNRLGYELKVVVLPAERSLMMADLGHVDGELLRTRAIEQKYKNVIRIPVPIYHAEFTVFSSKQEEPINDWSGLSGKAVGLINGIKIVEQNVPEQALISRAKNIRQLFHLLEIGRIQYAVFVKDIGEYFLSKNNISGISSGESILGSVPSYIYLNKKHMQLSKELTRTLRDMEKTGRFEELKKIDYGRLKKNSSG